MFKPLKIIIMKILRKITIFFVVGLLAASLSGCFGNFSLTRKVYEFNQTVTDNCLAQSLLFYGMNIIPVYSVAGTLDFFILNVIECWTGSNPLAIMEGEYEYQIVEYEDELYALSATKNKFTISKINGIYQEKLYEINFDEEEEKFLVYSFTNHFPDDEYLVSNTSLKE